MLYTVLTVSVCVFLLVVNQAEMLLAQQATERARLQFDVASLKPVQRSMLASMVEGVSDMLPAGNLPLLDPGRLHIQGWSLRHLVATAYRVRTYRVSGPGWIDDAYFDIVAKLPDGSKPDEAHEMLQALLAERLKLQLHRAAREVGGFALVVGKHGAKLQESAPSATTGGAKTPAESVEYNKEQMQEGLKALRARMQDQRGNKERMTGIARFTDFTTTQLADQLSRMLGRPVVDETGLTGKYNMEIETSHTQDDTYVQTILSAVEKFGLKLITRKVPQEFLVIDSVSKTPTAN